jgi:hypothetical protein
LYRFESYEIPPGLILLDSQRTGCRQSVYFLFVWWAIRTAEFTALPETDRTQSKISVDCKAPALWLAMRSKFYSELCKKYKRLGFSDIECYENEYFTDNNEDDEKEQEEEENDSTGVDDDGSTAPSPAPSSSPAQMMASKGAGKKSGSANQRGDCSSGYCSCAA